MEADMNAMTWFYSRNFNGRIDRSSHPTHEQSIALSNPNLIPPGLDSEGTKLEVLKAGTTVVIPSLPIPGRAEALPLRANVPVAAALSAINSLPTVRSETWKTGHIETPVQAALQSTTVANIPDSGEQWYIRAISADKVRRGDLGFLQQPVVAVVGVLLFAVWTRRIP
jgi:hypothetical protein